MERSRRPPRPVLTQVVAAVLLALIIAGVYLVLLRTTMDISQPTSNRSANARDTVYFALHLTVLVGAVVAGFGLGKWLNGLGLAYAVLMLAVMSALMVGAQAGSQTLACRGGHNDLVRHWTC